MVATHLVPETKTRMKLSRMQSRVESMIIRPRSGFSLAVAWPEKAAQWPWCHVTLGSDDQEPSDAGAIVVKGRSDVNG